MSYVRFGPDSDVYAYHNVHNGSNIVCMVSWEWQENFPEKYFTNHAELFRYLLYLRDNGLKVPNSAIVAVVQEDFESKLFKNATFPFVTKKTVYMSSNESLEHLCPEIDDEEDGDSPLLTNIDQEGE